MVDLSTTFAGLKLKNPIIVGSSGLTESVEYIQKLQKAGASAIVLKSIFEEEIIKEMQSNFSRMNSDVFLYPETVEYYEHDETIQESTEKYVKLVQETKQQLQIPVIASINCVTSEQWTHFPKRLELAGADAVELNVFLLPTNLKMKSAENEKIYLDIVSEVKKQVKIPIIVKISPYFSSLGNVIIDLSKSGASGIVMFNRYYQPDFDLDTFELTSANVLSNPTDYHQSLRWIAIMSSRVQCDLAATTGIHDGSSVIKEILAGASAVQLVSSIYKNGPEHIEKILTEIEEWMNKKSFKSIASFKGMLSQAKSDNPAAYERVQFMKYFRGYKQQ